MPDQSFGTLRRLGSAADFRHVFQRAERTSDRYFTVLARPSKAGRCRLGLAIARKNVRRAVDRNRIKRLVRESFRLRVSELPPLDIVVMARRDAVGASNAELFAALDALWRRIAAIST